MRWFTVAWGFNDEARCPVLGGLHTNGQPLCEHLHYHLHQSAAMMFRGVRGKWIDRGTAGGTRLRKPVLRRCRPKPRPGRIRIPQREDVARPARNNRPLRPRCERASDIRSRKSPCNFTANGQRRDCSAT
jgi:hypothetical protein